jgi:YVTN family beta-propeller protein
MNYPSNLVIISTPSNSVVGAITRGLYDAQWVAIAPSGTYAYVTNYAADNVVIIDTATNTVSASISGGFDFPYGVAFSPSGTYAYVVNCNSACGSGPSSNIVIVSTASNSVVGAITSGFDNPYDVAFSKDGSYAYVTNYNSANVVIISTSSNSVTGAITYNGFSNPYSVAFSPSGTYAYVGDGEASKVFIVDTATNTVTGSIAASVHGPYGIAFSPSGTYSYISEYFLSKVDVVGTGYPDNGFTYSIPSGQDGSTLVANVAVTDSSGHSANSINTGILYVSSQATTLPQGGGLAIRGSGGSGVSTQISSSTSSTTSIASTTTVSPTATVQSILPTSTIPQPPIEISVVPTGETTPQLCSGDSYGYNITYTSLGTTFEVAPGVHGCFNMTAINATSGHFSNSNGLIEAVNFTTSNNNITPEAIMHYPCSYSSYGVAPFILGNGSWSEIRPFVVNAMACSVTFAVPSDPVIAIMRINVQNQTRSATTSITATQPKQQSGFLLLLCVIIAVVILAIAALSVLSRRRRRRGFRRRRFR